jgi:AcrR family transcriptional regulator
VTVTTFKRARSEEQRTERRRLILATTEAMLDEMPAAQVTLNELSRRVGLAKSNVLRYFESREAVLLELLDIASTQWLGELGGALAAAVDSSVPPMVRGDQVAAVLVTTLTERPVLCDLISTQAAVLEHNVSTQIAAQYKHATIGHLMVLVGLLRDHIPELGEQDAARFSAATVMVTGAVWTYSRPSTAMLAAYEAEPGLAALRIEFAPTLRQTLEVLISGLLARSGRPA